MSSRARPKPQLSCGACRQRKLKCDRQQPCSRCARSRATCTYPLDSGPSVRPHASNAEAPDQLPQEVEQRVEALEKKLQGLISGIQNGSNGQEASSAHLSSIAGAEVHDSRPRLHIDGQRAHFIDSSHWEGILDDIAGIRQDLNANAALSQSLSNRSQRAEWRPQNAQSPQLLYGITSDISIDELLQPLISRSLIDSLLDLFLAQNRVAGLLIPLHIPTFRKRFDELWQAPDDMDLAWTASFYAVLSMASHTAFRLGVQLDECPHLDRLSFTCMRRAAQCLRRSDYLEPNEDTVSAMLMYLACEHPYAWQHGAFGATVVLGLAVRSALRLGYHRDPSHFPSMSVFEGEIRRRTWWFLSQLDQLLAVKSGLPRLIDQRNTDTALPQNLLDEDLDPVMVTLPPPRPMDQPTPVSFMNHKAALLEVMGKRSAGNTYDEVLQLDTMLSDTANRRPAWLTTQDGLGNVSAAVLVSAVEVDLIEQSARMQLHRSFLLAAHDDERYAFSRQRCLEAAERAIYLQSLLIRDSEGETNEAKHNWRFIALVGHDFLIAAMLLCLDLDHALKSKSPAAPGLKHLDPSEWQRREELIRQARDMWSVIGLYDDSGQQAASILTVLLQRFEAARSSSEGSNLPGVQSHEIGTAFPQAQGPATSVYTTWPEMDDMLQFQPLLDDSHIDIDWDTWASGLAASSNDFGINL